MDEVKIQMIGDKKLQKQLKRLDGRVRKRVLEDRAQDVKAVVRLYKSQITDSDGCSRCTEMVAFMLKSFRGS